MSEDLVGENDAVRDAKSGNENYDHRTTVISKTVIRLVVPIILLTAISLLFQGHNFPGGGFIGAVLTATAFVLVYVIFGLDYLRTELLALPDTSDEAGPGEDVGAVGMISAYRWMFSLGLALAAGAGLVPILFGRPFLTQGVAFFEHVPLYGEFEVATAFAFDLGVYFAVVGGLLTILEVVGRE